MSDHECFSDIDKYLFLEKSFFLRAVIVTDIESRIQTKYGIQRNSHSSCKLINIHLKIVRRRLNTF